MLKEDVTVQDLIDFKLTMTKVLHLLYIAKKYDVNPIRLACINFINDETTVKTVVEVYETLRSMNEDEREMYFLNFMIR